METSFNNYVILKTILENVSNSSDLLNSRLVCSKWNEVATRQLQKNNWEDRKIVDLMSLPNLHNFNIENLVYSCFTFQTTSEYSDLYSYRHQFRKYCLKFKALNLELCFSPSLELLSLFQGLNLSNLVELRVSLSKSSSINAAEQWLDTKAQDVQKYGITLPNLNYLCLSKEIGFARQSSHEDAETCLETVLKMIPPGKSVKMCLMGWGHITETIDILQKFKQIKSLKVLHISSIESGDFKELADAGVQLQYLKSPRVDENHPTLREFYKFHQSQDNCLEVAFWEWDGPLFIELRPVMTCLTKLQIGIHDGTSFGDTAHLVYQENFPHLRVLVICGAIWVENAALVFVSQFLGPQPACSSLRELTLDGVFDLEHTVIHGISYIFPNLTYLNISCFFNEHDGLVFPTLWNSSFSNTLQELHLLVNQFCGSRATYKLNDLYMLDGLFSGMDKAEVRKTWLNGTFRMKDFSQQTSILKFKNLRKLYLYSSGQRARAQRVMSKFSDFSIFCLFGRLNKLEYLHVDENLEQFSRGALGYLRQRKYSVTSGIDLETFGSASNNFEKFCETDFDSRLRNGSQRSKTLNLLRDEKLETGRLIERRPICIDNQNRYSMTTKWVESLPMSGPQIFNSDDFKECEFGDAEDNNKFESGSERGWESGIEESDESDEVSDGDTKYETEDINIYDLPVCTVPMIESDHGSRYSYECEFDYNYYVDRDPVILDSSIEDDESDFERSVEVFDLSDNEMRLRELCHDDNGRSSATDNDDSSESV